MSLFNHIKPFAFSLLLICGIAEQNSFANSVAQTEIVKVNMPNSQIADRFICNSHPKFQFYLKHNGIFDYNYARSQDKYIEDSINNILNKYMDEFILLHNTGSSPFDKEMSFNTVDCEDMISSDLLDAEIWVNQGKFDWAETRQKPHSDIRQFQIKREIRYGNYPSFSQTTVIVDTNRKQVVPFEQVVILSKLKSNKIQNIIRKRYQEVIEHKSIYYNEDEDKQRIINNFLSAMHFDNNIHLLNNGVVFWFTGNAYGYVLDEQFEVFIPYGEINPALQPRFRK